jgi:CheY-like chemotaxis protein
MTKKPINKVLLVEDNSGDARLLREMFDEQGSSGTELTVAQSMSEAEKYPAERLVDIVLPASAGAEIRDIAEKRRDRIRRWRAPVARVGSRERRLPAISRIAGPARWLSVLTSQPLRKVGPMPLFYHCD